MLSRLFNFTGDEPQSEVINHEEVGVKLTEASEHDEEEGGDEVEENLVTSPGDGNAVNSDQEDLEQEEMYASGEEHGSEDQHEAESDVSQEQDSDQDSNLAVTYAESDKSGDQENQGKIY